LSATRLRARTIPPAGDPPGSGQTSKGSNGPRGLRTLFVVAVVIMVVGVAIVLITRSSSHQNASPNTHGGNTPTTAAAGAGATTAKHGDDSGDNPKVSQPVTLPTVFASGWELRPGGSFGGANLQSLADPSGRFPGILRVQYPAGSVSPTVTAADNAPVGGAQMYLDRQGVTPSDSLDLRYFVRFPAGFDFVKGGKLPGLFGGTANSGKKIPDGTNGTSTRYMWRSGGRGEVYAYLPSSQSHGTSFGRGNWTFTPDPWHEIEQAVDLNIPGNSDGRIRVWFDRKLVLEQTGVVFRTTDSLKLEGLFFSTFFGGGDASWATPVSTHVDFADFALGPGPQGGTS
jgi:hypothetical protein